MPGRKRRMVKQPEHLLLRDSETLHMRFRTNFRLDRDEGFLGGGLSTVAFTFLTLLFAAIQIQTGDVEPMLMLLAGTFGVITLALYYMLAVRLYNQTHIDMDEDGIRVSRKPLPTLFNSSNTILLEGVTAIRCEETPESREKGFDTPRYRVWAEREDDSRRTIVNDVTEEYAYFVAQRMDERLQEDLAAMDEGETYAAAQLRSTDGELTDGELDFDAYEVLREKRANRQG